MGMNLLTFSTGQPEEETDHPNTGSKGILESLSQKQMCRLSPSLSGEGFFKLA